MISTDDSRRNKIEAIAFDLEGTVVDVESAHHQAHMLSARDVGVILSLENCFTLLPHFIGGPDDKVAEEISVLAAQQGIGADKEHIIQQKKIHYKELLTTLEIKPRAGFLEFFQAIKAMRLKYTIGSLTSMDQALVLLERSGIGELFGYENIILREDVKNLKPAPDVWYATAKKAGVRPENQIVFEDSPRGIQGAFQVGAYCIGMPVYNRPDIVKALVQAGAKRVFISWIGINPEKLIEDINDEH